MTGWTREYVYIPTRSRELQTAKPRYDPVPMERQPTAVWCLYAGRGDPNAQHDPALPLVCRETAWPEDIGHDWSWRNGVLTYSPGGERDGGIWLAVVFEEP